MSPCLTLFMQTLSSSWNKVKLTRSKLCNKIHKSSVLNSINFYIGTPIHGHPDEVNSICCNPTGSSVHSPSQYFPKGKHSSGLHRHRQGKLLYILSKWKCVVFLVWLFSFSILPHVTIIYLFSLLHIILFYEYTMTYWHILLLVLGLLSVWDYYQLSCYEHSCTCLLVDIHTPFSKISLFSGTEVLCCRIGRY